GIVMRIGGPARQEVFRRDRGGITRAGAQFLHQLALQTAQGREVRRGRRIPDVADRGILDAVVEPLAHADDPAQLPSLAAWRETGSARAGAIASGSPRNRRGGEGFS